MFIVFLLFYSLIVKGVPNLILCHIVRFLLTYCHIDCQVKIKFCCSFPVLQIYTFFPNKKNLMIIKNPDKHLTYQGTINNMTQVV